MLLFLFLYSNISAQQLMISDGTVNYKKDNRPCIEVNLEPEPKEVKDAFKDWLKDNYDVKLKGFGFLTNKDVLYAENVSIQEVSDKNLNFYTKVVEDGEQTKMSVFASYGYDIHINPEKYPRAFRKIEELTDNFVADYLPKFYQNRIKNAEERLSDLQKRQKDLEDNISDNKGDIEKMYKEIEELKKENEELIQDLSKNKDNLEKANVTLKSRKEELTKIIEKIDKM